jgi:exosortase D (VPLPA-CTERM-specific)
MVTVDKPVIVWRETAIFWALLSVASALVVFIFYDGIGWMVEWWNTREEYSHGIMIPFITLFLIWQRKHLLELIEFEGSWLGVAITFIGVSIFLVAELGNLWTVIMYSFLLTLYGVVLSVLGSRAFRVILMPLLILAFMLPLPNFLYNDLSEQLQLISSQIGVAFIRLFDISVYLEGNVIDLGSYKLQVVEACSGLRYLFPLMALGFIAAYFFTGAFWKKAIIFLSTIPITVLMNSLRIGAIGVTVEYWGPEMAEGFLHDFEGWFVFMGCVGILLIEMWILARIGPNKLPLREAFGLDFPEPTPDNAKIKSRPLPRQIIAVNIILVVALVGALSFEQREETIPERKEFVLFPLDMGEWKGRNLTMEQIYIDTLKLSDYILTDYTGDDGMPVNFYSAYYESQRKESTTHSPRACIPGGGWRITSHETHDVEGVNIGGVPLSVNRLVIQKGDVKQLVYYWFQQRGRIITSESILKWYFFVDSISRNRTDGALVRITTVLLPGQDISIADERLREFAKTISPILQEYVPD